MQQSEEGAAAMPCFWLRGIMPAEWTNVGDAPEAPQQAQECEDFQTREWFETLPHATAGFSDGSGGPRWVEASLRRAGGGGALVSFDAGAEPGQAIAGAVWSAQNRLLSSSMIWGPGPNFIKHVSTKTCLA